MQVLGLVVAQVASVAELPLLVEVDDVLVLVHPAHAVEPSAAKVTNVRPDLVMSVFDVKLLRRELMAGYKQVDQATSGSNNKSDSGFRHHNVSFDF